MQLIKCLEDITVETSAITSIPGINASPRPASTGSGFSGDFFPRKRTAWILQYSINIHQKSSYVGVWRAFDHLYSRFFTCFYHCFVLLGICSGVMFWIYISQSSHKKKETIQLVAVVLTSLRHPHHPTRVQSHGAALEVRLQVRRNVGWGCLAYINLYRFLSYMYI